MKLLHRTRRASAHLASTPHSKRLGPYCATRRWGISDATDPIALEHMQDIFSQRAESTNQGGLSRTASLLRTDFATSLVFGDEGATLYSNGSALSAGSENNKRKME